MRKQLLILIGILFFSVSFSQNIFNREKAESSVTKYMARSGYTPISFGELFDQTYPKEIQEKLKTKISVVYSILHTYSIGNKRHVNDYFHLDKDYYVIGILTDKEMTKISTDLLEKSGKLDSILKTLEIPQEKK